MINGAHAILYSHDADATHAALAKVLGTRSVDAGGGWLIFALPPGRARRPPGPGGRRGRAVPTLRRRGRPPSRRGRGRQAGQRPGLGLLTAIALPAGWSWVSTSRATRPKLSAPPSGATADQA
jgi:hypothetical protein